MIIDHTEINGEPINIFMCQVGLDSGPCYLVNVWYSGDGMPPAEELKRQISEAVRPDVQFHSIEDLRAFVLSAVESGEWHYPLLLMPSDYGFQHIEEPTEPFTAGREAFLRGLPFNANAYRDNDDRFDEWDQGWLMEREKVSSGSGESSVT